MEHAADEEVQEAGEGTEPQEGQRSDDLEQRWSLDSMDLAQTSEGSGGEPPQSRLRHKSIPILWPVPKIHSKRNDRRKGAGWGEAGSAGQECREAMRQSREHRAQRQRPQDGIGTAVIQSTEDTASPFKVLPVGDWTEETLEGGPEQHQWAYQAQATLGDSLRNTHFRV